MLSSAAGWDSSAVFGVHQRNERSEPKDFGKQVKLIPSNRSKTWLRLSLLSAAAVLVHGYHPFAEDAEIYLPGVEKILHPDLFPIGQEFFRSHASMTWFPNLIAFSLRLSHVGLLYGLFLWHIASIFLLLLACWQLSGEFFSSSRARWCSVCLVATLLTIPVAGTALYIVDQYLNPRNLAAFGGVFALTRLLQQKYLATLLWLIFSAGVHPLMWVFPASFCLLLLVLERVDPHWQQATSVRSLSVIFLPLSPAAAAAYQEAAKRHAYFYLQNWQWYEWLGIVAPLFLFAWFAHLARRRNWLNVERVSRAFVAYGIIYFVIALVLDLPARFERLARIQPMRSLHFSYTVMFLLIGGLLGEYAVKASTWRWLLLFLPLSFGMFVAQRALFPASQNVEWPWGTPKNPWAQAFTWARLNTPVDAVFALDPEYMNLPGEDHTGFRCLAERSRLADGVKDNGVVSMFPQLAEEWWTQVQAQTPWKDFGLRDFERLRIQQGVGWVVLQNRSVEGLNCEYNSRSISICRIP